MGIFLLKNGKQARNKISYTTLTLSKALALPRLVAHAVLFGLEPAVERVQLLVRGPNFKKAPYEGTGACQSEANNNLRHKVDFLCGCTWLGREWVVSAQQVPFAAKQKTNLGLGESGWPQTSDEKQLPNATRQASGQLSV